LPELVCDTSSLQYLHQLGCLNLLHELADRIIVPRAVVDELAVGSEAGHSVPIPQAFDWIEVCRPSALSAEPRMDDLGAGETEVLMLVRERADAIAVIDDKLARVIAENLGIKFTGTLGILVEAKRAGLIDSVGSLLDRLQELRFRVSPSVRALILREAGE